MAVEAHHLLHTGGAGGQRQLLARSGWVWAGDGACYDAPASAARQGQQGPCYGVAAWRPTATGQKFQQSCVLTPPAPSAAVAEQLVMPGRYAAGPHMCAADASESGVTFGGGGAQQEVMMVPRKRKRDDEVLSLGAADVAAHFQQQLVDVDRLVLQHSSKMLSEMTEQRRRHMRQAVAVVETVAIKRLRVKDEEIERIGRLNWALEERVKSLYAEAQAWRDLAQSNEAAANALRGELQQALDAGQARGGVPGPGADDAESCCCGENDVEGGKTDHNEEDEAGTTGGRGRMCTMCGEGTSEVLLLPCRHLCACISCMDEALACPVCGCNKNGYIRVLE